MKKTLLVAAAILAAAAITAQAAVYSANIVGYMNTQLVPGYSAICNTFDIGTGNTLTNMLPNVPVGGVGPLDGTTVYLWNGAGYTVYTLDSGQPTGVGDSADNNAVPSPTVNPGSLVFFYNNTATTFTNTIVGTVHVDAAATGTQTVGSTTNVLAPGYTFLASKIPVAGGISSALGLTNTVVGGAGILDGTTLYIPTISNGTFQGYNVVTFDAGQPTGFGDSADNNPVSEPVIPAGSGFIFNNNTPTTFQWVQTF